MRLAVVVLLLTAAALTQEPAVIRRDVSVDIITELQTKLDARKAKVGDPVRLKLMHPLVEKGKVTVPEGATVTGTITEVVTRSGDNPSSHIGVKIDRAEWKSTSVPLDAVIVGHSQLVQKIVRGRGGPTVSENKDADFREALSNADTTPQPPPQPTTAPSPAAPSQTASGGSTDSGSASTPLSNLPAEGQTPPATTSTQTQRWPTKQAPTNAQIERQGEERYRPDVMIHRGPKAEGVAVTPTGDPSIGSKLVSTSSRDVVVPKGVLILLRQRTAE